jgi:hypothetical protein
MKEKIKLDRQTSTKVKSLAKKFEICYGIPEAKSVQFLDCNSGLQVVKFALNGDFVSQNAIANKIKGLLNVKLEKKNEGI